MQATSLPLPGLVLLEPRVHEDTRGFFYESHNQNTFRALGVEAVFVQDNVSRSRKGVLRGLHFQTPPHAQGKLVRVTGGSAYDVAVDIRKGSPTYGRGFGLTLSAHNRLSLYIPPGFAHGFLALEDGTEFVYKCTDYYAPAADSGLLWSDPDLGLAWPLPPDPALISAKDKALPPLARVHSPFDFSS
jgi:dTDP-4-dehydrorhamnose 3,5-epimerase